ncbi:MAG: hypothetical protein IKY83_08595, partial [Proteobacteria bacterium]|nr:hypothetical protein [Pseudomonadota bacterium]
SDESCVSGKCQKNTCGTGQTLCALGSCKTLNGTDKDNCGACNYACANNPAPNATSNTCKDGVCQYTCDTNYTNCGGVTAASIKCIKTTDLQTDSNNCGKCNNACKSDESCVSGKCQKNTCGTGQTLCALGSCKTINGTDKDNCGACNYACSNNPATNATSDTCAAGVCQYTCNTGYKNCGGTTIASVNCIKTESLQTDPNNCGSCGTKCTGDTPVCISGVCSMGCPSSQTACHGQCFTTSILTSMFHMKEDCSCDTGYENANGNWADGCEATSGGGGGGGEGEGEGEPDPGA